MNAAANRLYDLLPTVYKVADSREGEPLRQLLGVIESHLAVLQEDADCLYDDQFIETCAEWLTPYIGDLIGYRPLNDTSNSRVSARAEVANTIAYRRRKGTITVLEQLARDVTDWDSRAVEFFQRLIVTQYMNHLRPHSQGTANMRDWEALERRDTAFDSHSHTAEVRRIQSRQARFNIPYVGIYLWRLEDQPLRRSPAVRIDDRRFVFSPLGNDTQLFTNAVADDEITRLSEPLNTPERISYRVLHKALLDKERASYYGRDLSLFLEADGVDTSRANIRVCHLGDLPSPPAAVDTWARTPLQVSAEHPETIAIDPELGRITFADPQPADREVFVSYRYAFSAPLGGGEYFRGRSFAIPTAPDVAVQHGDDLQAGLDQLVGGGLMEAAGNGRFEQRVRIEADNAMLEFRAAEGSRPAIVTDRPIEVELRNKATVILNGLMIAGGALTVTGEGTLIVRHCTLAPGVSLDRGGNPVRPGDPSIIADSNQLEVAIADSIVGPVYSDAFSELTIDNSIVDATRNTGVALAAIDGADAGAVLTASNVTLVGKVHSRLIKLASNTIFDARLADADPWEAPVQSVQTQDGCVRFSYVPPGSVTPRRHRCQPDLEISRSESRLRELNPMPLAAELATARTLASARTSPAFVSRRYGEAPYMQLGPCVVGLGDGADDESEMGAFHNVFAPQRENNLRIRLEEYLRFRLEAGIFRAS